MPLPIAEDAFAFAAGAVGFVIGAGNRRTIAARLFVLATRMCRDGSYDIPPQFIPPTFPESGACRGCSAA